MIKNTFMRQSGNNYIFAKNNKFIIKSKWIWLKMEEFNNFIKQKIIC